MDAQAQAVVQWLMLVGVTAGGALLAELALQRRWGHAAAPPARR